MSFIGNAEVIKPFISPATYNALVEIVIEGEFNTFFDLFVSQSDKIIRDITGVDIPDDFTEAPEWALLPSAYIIEKLAIRQLSNLSKDFIDTVEANYQAALKDLSQRDGADDTTIGTPASTGIVYYTVDY